MRILYAEDDVRMRALVRRGLSEEGHAVHVVADAAATLSTALAMPFDVIVLDVMLPDGSGIDVVRALRARAEMTPVLMLTARDTQADVVAGLDAGADDYLTKPFAFDVLLARLRALVRRVPSSSDRLVCEDLVLDPSAHTVRRSGESLALTPTEFRLLECLMRRRGRVVTRAAIVESLWGSARDVEANTLDAFVRLVRQKIERHGQTALIHTVRGVGYRLGHEVSS